MARFRWFGMRFFPLLSLGLATTAGASPSNEGVVLRPFQSGYPDETMIYEGEEARRLAREILPVAVDRLARVIVHESIMLPGGMYYGLSMEFELAPRVIAQTLCEQQLMIVSMTPDNRSVPRGEVRLLLRDGRLEGHNFNDYYQRGRFRRIQPDDRRPTEALEETCRRLGADTANWKLANDQQGFLEQERHLNWLITTLSSGAVRISCAEADRLQCGTSPAPETIKAILAAMPPQYSQSLFVPDQGTITVFRYSTPANPGEMSYSYTIKMQDKGREPTEISFASRRDPVPVI